MTQNPPFRYLPKSKFSLQHRALRGNIKRKIDDLSVVKQAGILYGIDSYIMEKLAEAQEETGYIEVLEHDFSTYNKIDIEFVTNSYEYNFGSYVTVKSRSYTKLATYDLSKQFAGYVGYRLTWEDGEIISAKELD